MLKIFRKTFEHWLAVFVFVSGSAIIRKSIKMPKEHPTVWKCIYCNPILPLLRYSLVNCCKCTISHALLALFVIKCCIYLLTFSTGCCCTRIHTNHRVNACWLQPETLLSCSLGLCSAINSEHSSICDLSFMCAVCALSWLGINNLQQI